VDRGITALVGGGGKTTLLYALASALSLRGRVIVTTSTHIFPPEHLPILSDPSDEAISKALAQNPILCIGTSDGRGKLTASIRPPRELLSFCDYVLVEADGAKRLPLKAPASHEPVLPDGTDHVIAVAGLDGIGKTIQQTVFRPELFAALVQKHINAIVSPQDVACVLQHSMGQRKIVSDSMRFSVVLNKADTPALHALGETVARDLDESLVSVVLIAALGKKLYA